jgi:hypothetical protein
MAQLKPPYKHYARGVGAPPERDNVLQINKNLPLQDGRDFRQILPPSVDLWGLRFYLSSRMPQLGCDARI